MYLATGRSGACAGAVAAASRRSDVAYPKEGEGNSTLALNIHPSCRLWCRTSETKLTPHLCGIARQIRRGSTTKTEEPLTPAFSNLRSKDGLRTSKDRSPLPLGLETPEWQRISLRPAHRVHSLESRSNQSTADGTCVGHAWH